jgi:SAM-dependent methyltransferase
LYDAIYEPSRDYADQARQIKRWILLRKSDATAILDVACGTGLHLSNLRRSFRVEGLDASDAMLRIARVRNPGLAFHHGDMRDFATGHLYDAVICLFSSITYALTFRGLRNTLRTFADHLKPGGVCIVEPFIPAEAWHDLPTGQIRIVDRPKLKVAMVERALRVGRIVTREIGYVAATQKGVRLIPERHKFGLFTGDEYWHAFRHAGFQVEFDPVGFSKGRGMYFGVLREPNQ